MFALSVTIRLEGGLSQLLLTADAVPSSLILFAMMMESYVPLKRRFPQEQLGVTSQKKAFFIITTVKTSNLT
jgi:hypothetical protein